MASTVEERLKEVAAVGQEIAETGIAYLDGAFTPLADAKISIATHALQYGTAVFEGIRAYWNPAREQLYAFRLRDHYARMARNVRILRIALPGTADALSALTADGHVSEGGGANLFMLRDGVLVTPPVTADILEGITRDTIMVLTRELGMTVEERPIDRTELYVADEVFFCGTGAQVAPCVTVDARPVADAR